MWLWVYFVTALAFLYPERFVILLDSIGKSEMASAIWRAIIGV